MKDSGHAGMTNWSGQMMTNSRNSNVFLLFSCLLFLLLPACGRKGDPSLKSYEKPDAPSGLKAIHRESEIIMSWEFPKMTEQGIKGFHLMKSSDGDFRKIAFIERDKRFYTDTNFSPGKEYHYRILSENLKGITNDSVILSIKPLPPPPPPVNLTFEVHHEILTLSWESSDETQYFNIYKSAQKGQYTLTPLNSQPLKETSFRDSFDINRTVFYTVRNSAGSAIRDEGPHSEELEVNPLAFIPSAPQNLIAVPTAERIFLIWKEPPETWVTGYRVYREADKQKGYVLLGFTYTPSFVDREDITAKRNYRVTALGPQRESPPAEIKDILYEPPR